MYYPRILVILAALFFCNNVTSGEIAPPIAATHWNANIT